jgi:hypothetical protein
MAEEKLTTVDIDDVEIFEAGHWNGDTYTENDIDEIVNSFNEIGGQLKPYLKLGHSRDQKLLQADGYPAAGWVTGLKRNGKKLMASIKGVPEKIATLIKNKAYGRISSEIFWNLKLLGKNYPRALKAIALLGGNTPEVVTLNDFVNLYTEGFEYDKLILCSEDTMDEQLVKTYTDQINELNLKVKNFEMEIKTKDDKIASQEDELKSRDEKIVTFEKEKVEMFAREVGATFDGWIKDGKMSPAQKESIIKVCDTPEKFDNVKTFMKDQGTVINMTEEAKHIEADKGKTEDEKLDSEAKEYMKKNSITYREALIAVSQEKGGK